jgi:pimeloyl-ACP methyl ester carboxylesterase
MSRTELGVNRGRRSDEAPQEIPPGRTVHLGDRGSSFVRVSNAPVGASTVLLLHGLGATADLNWSATFPALSGSFRVVAPDLRGHGQAVTSGPFTLEDAADDVAALVDALSLGPVIVVGYSMGGAIAQLLCRRHPDIVRGLVLCATSSGFNVSWPHHMMFAAVPPLRAASCVVPDEVARAAARFIVGRLVGEVPEPRPDPQIFDIGKVLDAVYALGSYRSHRWIGTLDVASAVLVHVRDQLVPPHQQFGLARALSRAAVYPINGDHFAVVKKPRVFARTLVRAVRDVRRRAILDDAQQMETRAAS